MLTRLHGKLNYSNVVATLAIFLALGGTSYAAVTITSKNVKNESLTGSDIKNRSLTGKDVRDGSLTAADFARGQVPSGSAGPKGDAGPQGAPGADGQRGSDGANGTSGANGADAAAGQRTVLTPGDPERAVVTIEGLGEIRGNCNTNNGGSLALYYKNSSSHAVDMWQDSVRDGAPDARDVSFLNRAAGTSAGFVNTTGAQRHVFYLSADGLSAQVTVSGVLADGHCVVQVFTIAG